MLHKLRERGLKNGVEGLRVLDREEALAMEPNLSDQVLAALYAPTAGIVCPFELNIAMAENAYNNGVEFKFDTEVKKHPKTGKRFLLWKPQKVILRQAVSLMLPVSMRMFFIIW